MNTQTAVILENFKTNLGILARAVNEQSKTIKDHENHFRLIEQALQKCVPHTSQGSNEDKIKELIVDLMEKKGSSPSIEVITEDRIKQLIAKNTPSTEVITEDKIKQLIAKNTTSTEVITEDKIKSLITEVLNNVLNTPQSTDVSNLNEASIDSSVDASVDASVDTSDDIKIVEKVTETKPKRGRAKKVT